MRGVEGKGSAGPRDAIGFPRRWTTGRIALVLALLLVLGLDPARYITHATASVPLRLTRSGQAHTTGIVRAPAPVHRAPSIRPAAITCTPNVSCSIDSSGGTLDHIVVGADTTVQVIYPSLSPDAGEVYPPDAGLDTGETTCTADSGIWVVIAGTLYGPDFFDNSPIHCAGSATGSISPDVFFTPVSQVASGSGTNSDPYTVVTTVGLGSGMTLVQRITYVVGTKYFHQTVTLTGNTAPATIYHGTDIYLLGSDSGYGYYDPITGAIGGRNVVNASDQPVDCSDPQAQPGTFYEVEVPDPSTPAQHYDEARYAQVWSDIQAGTQGTPLPDTVDTDVCEDNGTALEWDNVAAGSTIGDAMSFSLGSVVIPPTYTPTATPTSTPTVTQTPMNSPTVTSTPTATATVTTPCSTLTSQQPAAIFGANLILNPGAEAGPASADGNTVEPVPNWTTTGNFTVVCYGAPNFPSRTDPGPPNRGQAFFAGGPNNALSTASQTIDVSAVASQVDAGGVTFTLSGYLGGFDSQSDNAVLTASFIGAQAQILGAGTIGPVTVADRNGQTGLLFRSTAGTLPVGTRSIQLLLTMTRTEGTYNDGYADNLSLVLNAPAVASPTTTSTPTATATVPPVLSCALRVKPLPMPVNPTQQQQIVYTAPPGATITTTFLASSAGGAPYPAQITVISQVGKRLTLIGAPVMVDGQAGYQYTFPLDSLGHAIVTFTIPPDATAQTVTILTSYQPSCVNTTTFQVL